MIKFLDSNDTQWCEPSDCILSLKVLEYLYM